MQENRSILQNDDYRLFCKMRNGVIVGLFSENTPFLIFCPNSIKMTTEK